MARSKSLKHSFFFFNDTATTEIYTLSLHDALPIYLGFIETPYRIVKNGKVSDEIRWLSASEEEEYAVAQANARVAEDGHFADELVLCRKRDDYPLLAPGRIDFMDVAPEQLVSIAAAL